MNRRETYRKEIVLVDCIRGMESGVCKVNDDCRRKKKRHGTQGKGGGIYVDIMYK